MIKSANQITVFVLELIMFITYGYYGMSKQWNFIPRHLFTMLIVSAAITLWAILAAPKSAHRLKMPYLLIFRATMFLFAAMFLLQLEHKNMAIAMALLTIITQTISYFTEK